LDTPFFDAHLPPRGSFATERWASRTRAGVQTDVAPSTLGERPRDNTKTEGGISMAKKTAKGGKKKATKKR
jgi:hypothetical protein